MTSVRRRKYSRTGLVGGAALILIGIASAAIAAPAKLRNPMKLPDTQYEATTWAGIDGWADDDHDAAFAAFVKSCKAVLRVGIRDARPVYAALYQVCLKAAAAKLDKPGAARAFFEQNFRPVRIAPLGQADGFLTGYYEPIVEGTR